MTMTCEECESYNVDGPTYMKCRFQGERLMYWCRRCGYQFSRPTADNVENGEGPGAIIKQLRKGK